MDLKRLKNKGIYVLVFSFVALLAKELGLDGYIPENYDYIVDTVLTLLVALGILNNNTTNKE